MHKTLYSKIGEIRLPYSLLCRRLYSRIKHENYFLRRNHLPIISPRQVFVEHRSACSPRGSNPLHVARSGFGVVTKPLGYPCSGMLPQADNIQRHFMSTHTNSGFLPQYLWCLVSILCSTNYHNAGNIFLHFSLLFIFRSM